MNNAQIFTEGCPRCALLVNVCVIVSGGWQHVFLKSGRGPKKSSSFTYIVNNPKQSKSMVAGHLWDVVKHL